MQAIADDFVLPAPSSSVNDDIATPSLTANKCARIEEVEDEDVNPPHSGLRFTEQYPRSIAHPIGLKKTQFEEKQDQDDVAGKQPWEPFASKEEWELATWLIDNVNQKATDKYLKLPIVS
jgi:hypothetical protein